MNVMHSMIARIKKYIWLIFIVPIFLAIVGWFVPVGGEPSDYTAETTIALGDYHTPDANDPERVTALLSNASFYQDRLPSLWRAQRENLLGRLKVIQLNDRQIQLSFSGGSEDEAVRIVSRVTEAFLAYDREQFQKREQVINRSIDAMKGARVSQDAAVDRQRFLYELETARLEIKPAELLEAADAGTHLENRAFSSKERAVLGGMLGVTIMFFWVILPEFVRKR
ncbi:hydrolase [Sporolactobacillus sp. THM7-7]|nr:hydrolase [Sporolactobacillus sp. THM7-7]